MRPNNEDVFEITEYRRKIEELEKTSGKVRAERDRLLELKRRIESTYDDGCNSEEL